MSPDAAQFAVLLSVALAISIGAERLRVPAAVALVAVGIAAGTMWHAKLPFQFGPALLFVFLPPLIYEAAWSLDLRELKRQWPRVALLAGPGTVFVALAVAAVVAAVSPLSFPAALLLGAIVSATDPVAVVSVFRSTLVPAALRTLIEAESLSNDGVAVAIYSAASVLVAGAAVSWGVSAAAAIVAIGGGILIGAVCAVPIWFALLATEASEYEVSATVGLAYASFLISDVLHCSGIFACASAAIVLRALLRRRQHVTNRTDVDAFWSAAAYMSNAVVFLGTGVLVALPRLIHEPLLVGATVLVVLLSRALLATVAVSDARDRLTFFMAGMRGALPLALALAIPANVPGRSQIIDAVFATVLVTLVLQGIPLKHVLARLYSAGDVEGSFGSGRPQ